eukprot:scaffold422998_cov63-Attheya_sp.AAC.1
MQRKKGYDTRCIRLGLSIPCFEVDQPEVHCLKKAGLEDLNLTDEGQNRVILIPVDFNKNESIVKKVGDHPEFQKGAKTVVIMEEASQYIPNESTAEALTQVNKAVVYSNDTQDVERESGIKHDKLIKMLEMVKKVESLGSQVGAREISKSF